MEKNERIARASAEDIRRKLDQEGSKTDWQRARSHSQEHVEHLADEDDGPLPEGWESTIELGIPEPKKGVHIPLDPHVLRWFKAQGPGYQTRINAVLRGFVEARERAGDGDRKAD